MEEMIMKKRIAAVLYSATILIMASMPAMAQDVTILGEPCVFTLQSSREEGAEQVEKEVESFRLFGRAGEDFVLIRTGEEDEYIRREELESLLPELDLDALPDMDEIETAGNGLSSASVQALQQTLADLGYLTGKVDGIFGPGTSAAIKAFQEETGLEATGQADVYTMLLLTAAGNGVEDSVEVSSKGYTTPEEKFAAIAGNTEADLAAFMEPKWRFHFDPFTEQGEIDPGITLGSFAVETPAIDRISGVLSVKAFVNKNGESGLYDVVPVLTLETEGAYRPYLQSAILSGDETVNLEETVTSGELDGVTMKETARIPLSAKAVQALQKGKTESIRLQGRNTTYDIETVIEDGNLTAFMEACGTIMTN